MIFRLPIWGWSNGCDRANPTTFYYDGGSIIPKMSPMLKSWMKDNHVGYSIQTRKGMVDLTIADPRQAVLFKLTWM